MAKAAPPRYTLGMPGRTGDLWTLLRRRAGARPRLNSADRAMLRRALLPLLLVVLAALLGNWLVGTPTEARPTPRHFARQQILDAIRFVESSDRADVPDGDQGKAIGPYQIHEVYWQDALRFEPALGGGYQDCRQRPYAERVIAAYMQHYVAEAWRDGDAEVIARVHNGGPQGFKSPATLGYWRRVLARLQR